MTRSGSADGSAGARSRSQRTRALLADPIDEVLPRSEWPALCPAGQLIDRRLQVAGVTRQQFADAIGFATRFEVVRLLNGTKRVSPAIAARLERFFDISAQRWLHLQLRHDIATLNPAYLTKIVREVKPLEVLLAETVKDTRR